MPARPSSSARGLHHSPAATLSQSGRGTFMSRITLRHLLSQITRRRPALRTTLRLEQMEERRNPVTATYSSFTRILDVQGSAPGQSFPNDRIVLLEQNGQVGVFDARSGRLVQQPIKVDGLTSGTVPASEIDTITVEGNGGNDLIDLNSPSHGFEAINVPASITGGSGNDSIAGGEGNDTILGLSGSDLIFGNGGQDSIDGGDGAGRVVGRSETDTLDGRTG